MNLFFWKTKKPEPLPLPYPGGACPCPLKSAEVNSVYLYVGNTHISVRITTSCRGVQTEFRLEANSFDEAVEKLRPYAERIGQ